MFSLNLLSFVLQTISSMIYPAAIKHLSLLLATSSCFMTNNLVESAPCGRWYSSSCLAESDKRYDTSYTNNIREQDSLWADQEGFWLATTKSYDSNDQPNQPMTFDPTNLATGFGLPHTRDISAAYVNITLSVLEFEIVTVDLSVKLLVNTGN